MVDSYKCAYKKDYLIFVTLVTAVDGFHRTDDCAAPSRDVGKALSQSSMLLPLSADWAPCATASAEM